jgi:hypothetical protein
MNIILRFFDICLFRSGPDELPDSKWLKYITLIVYFSIGVPIGNFDSDWNIAVWASLADMMLMILVVWLVLYVRGFMGRYNQTITAMAGTGSIVGLISIPIFTMSPDMFNVHSLEVEPSMAFLLLISLFLLWSLMVIAHIFRRAFEIKPISAVILTIIYIVLAIAITALVTSGAA